MSTATKFPIGGPREPVYALLRSHDYVQSNWSDKHWHRRDGISAHIYGAGSQVRILKGETLLYDGPLTGAALITAFARAVTPTGANQGRA